MFNNVEKPIFMLHTNGGKYNTRHYSWYRDIPYLNAKDVVDYFKNDYHIYHIGYEGQILIEGCHKLTLDTRNVGCIILF